MYIGTFLFLFILSVRERLVVQNRSFEFWWACCFLLLIVHDGLRWETGTDWKPYLSYFENCLKIGNVGFELAYVALNKAVRAVSDNYTIFLLLHAIVLYSLVFSSLRKYSEAPFLSLFLYYVWTLPYLGMNRQFLALGICLYSLRFLIFQKNLVRFFLCVFLASLFHRSAYIYIVVPFLLRKFSLGTYILVGCTVCFLSVTSIAVHGLDFLLRMISNEELLMRAKVYSEGEINSSRGFVLLLAYLKRLIWIILFLFIYSRNKNIFTKKDFFFFNLYYFGVLLFLLFNGTQYQIIVARALLFFNIIECLLLVRLVMLNRDRLMLPLLYGLLLIYGILLIEKGLSAYERKGADNLFIPYKGVFINREYHRRMW